VTSYEIKLRVHFILSVRPSARKGDRLSGILGRHKHCGGDISLIEGANRIIICNRCSNTKSIPDYIETFRNLDDYVRGERKGYDRGVNTIDLSSYIDKKVED
jgi:hypothetical protein